MITLNSTQLNQNRNLRNCNNQQRQSYGKNQVAFGSKETLMAGATKYLERQYPLLNRTGIHNSAMGIPATTMIGTIGGLAKICSATLKIPLKGLQILPKEVKELKDFIRALSKNEGRFLRHNGRKKTARIFTEIDILKPFKK